MHTPTVQELKIDFINRTPKYNSYFSTEHMRILIAAEKKYGEFSAHSPSFHYVIKRNDLVRFLKQLKETQTMKEYQYRIHLLLEENNRYMNLDILWTNTVKKACIFHLSDEKSHRTLFIEVYKTMEFSHVFSVSNHPDMKYIQDEAGSAIFALYIAIQAAQYNLYHYFQSYFPNKIHLLWCDLPFQFVCVSQTLKLIETHAKQHNMTLYSENAIQKRILNYWGKYGVMLRTNAFGHLSNHRIKPLFQTYWNHALQWLRTTPDTLIEATISNPMRQNDFPWERLPRNNTLRFCKQDMSQTDYHSQYSSSASNHSAPYPTSPAKERKKTSVFSIL